MGTTAERVAQNESAFREANERIAAAGEAMLDLDAIPFICECPHTSCTEIVRLTRAQYERVRSRGNTFWVARGHEVTAVDGVEIAQVAEPFDDFTIMEKIGEAGEIAKRLDPRRAVESEAG